MDTDFELSGFVQSVVDELGKNEWVDVYLLSGGMSEFQTRGTYSAFVKNEKVGEVLENISWDIQMGYGMPGHIFSWKDGMEIAEYDAYYNRSVFPIVFSRYFPTIRKTHLEPLQEFCHYFDLLEDKDKGIFYQFDDCGNPVESIRISENRVSVRLRLLKEFASVKNLSIVLFFDAMNFSKNTLEELGIPEVDETVKLERITYRRTVRNNSLGKGIQAQSWVLGKKIVPGLSDFQPSLFEKGEFESFVIGTDEEGKERLYTCDKDSLSDYFGKNPDAPNYLTPVLFRKEVLKKYYDTPSRYSVDDGHLTSFGLWTLRLDNNQDDRVAVFLGDLGDLPHKEQLHWKQYNISGEAKLSHASWTRSFKGEPSDPEQPDLFFKYRFEQFGTKWFEKYGFDLFLPLKKEDAHCYHSLHSPLTEEQKEFDEQVLSLTKIFVDSINEAELEKRMEKSSEDEKGIDKFSRYLSTKGFSCSDMVAFLRNLQSLRSSGVAHRKGGRYEKIKKDLGIGSKSNKEVFEDLLIGTIRTLNTLERRFLKNGD